MPMPTAARLFLRANLRHFAELLLASGLINLFALAPALFSMLVYDKAVGNPLHDTLWALTLGMALLLSLEAVLRMARVYVLEHAGSRWDVFLDERLMRGVLSGPLTPAMSPADVMARLREVAAARDVLSAQSLLAVADLPFLVLMLGLLTAIGGNLVLVPLAVAGILQLWAWVCHQRAAGHVQAAGGAMRAKLRLLHDAISTRETLQGPALTAYALSAWRPLVADSARSAARARWWGQLHLQLVPVGAAAASVATMVYCVYLVEAQAMSIGGMIAANILASRVVSTLAGVAPLLHRWQEFRRAMAGLGEAVDLQAKAPTETLRSGSGFATEGVRLEAVDFHWPGQSRPVLGGINLQLRPGELVVLLGASGAGKSTLLRLLAGVLAPSAGRVSVAGHQIDDEAARAWLRTQAHHKAQDPSHLGMALGQVVAGGAVEADEARLLTALRNAGLGPALDRGELGLSTPVGTHGAGLSGGQRQMLALAAALYSEAPLLLLDEPTLGLDRRAQQQFLQALPPLRAGRCVLVATHAHELIERADRLLVLDGGRVVADGPPHRLLSGAAAGASAADARPDPAAARPPQLQPEAALAAP